MNKQLELIREVEEQEQKRPIADRLREIGTGEYFKSLRKMFDAIGVNAEAYTVSKLYDCDIYVDGNQIAYEVTEAFPEVSHNQVLIWLCQHAEKHHEVYGTVK